MVADKQHQTLQQHLTVTLDAVELVADPMEAQAKTLVEFLG